MINNEKNEEVKSGVSSLNLNQVNEPKHVELTEKQRLQRAFETGKLFEEKEDLIKARAEREKQKREEIVELQSGLRIPLKSYIGLKRRPYKAEFPNDEPFFAELLRVYFPGADPKKYRKPRGTGEILKDIIYKRFPIEVFPVLNSLNPILPGVGRKYKLYQDLNDDGLGELRRFRDESVDVLRTCEENEGEEFRKKLWELHRVPFQTKVFNPFKTDAFKKKKP